MHPAHAEKVSPLTVEPPAVDPSTTAVPSDPRGSRLRWRELVRAVKFGTVGLSGLVVDVAVFAVVLTAFSAGWARAVALWAAMTWNFTGNSLFTFRDRPLTSLWQQYLGYCCSCGVGAVVNWITSITVMSQFPWTRTQLWLPLAAGAISGMGFNYVLCHWWVFGAASATNESGNDSQSVSGSSSNRQAA